MLDYAEKAVKIAQKQGCIYCDVRAETVQRQELGIENGQIEHNTTKDESGFGIRVLCDGAWGFFSTSDHKLIEDGITRAVKAAKYYANKKINKVTLAETPSNERTVRYSQKKEATIDGLTDISFECDKILKSNSKIIKSITHGLITNTFKYFTNTEGSKIQQEFTDVTMELTAISHQSGLTQSVNTTEGGRGGLEKIIESDIYSISKNISDKAVALLDAKIAKEEKATIVMDPDFVALLTHEILGHPSEADRVLGKEMAWAGGAWWSGMLGQKIGSDQLNVIDDPTMPGSLGWYDYDDEGTRSQRKQLISDGMLVNHMHSRETASIFRTESNANMRATSYAFMPLIRMACTCIDGGDFNPHEIIKGVKHGYFVSGMKIPSIDMKRHNWNISCQYANKIENGEIKELLRDVIVSGTAPEFFNSIDACGKDFTMRPITNCGKGDPMQQMKMGNGGPTIRGTATIRGIS